MKSKLLVAALCFVIVGCQSIKTAASIDPPPLPIDPPSGDAAPPSFVTETDGSCATPIVSCGTGSSVILPSVSITSVAKHGLLVVVWFNDTPDSQVSGVENGVDTFKSLGSIKDTVMGTAGVGVFLAQNIAGGASNINVTIQRPNGSPSGVAAAIIMVREYAGVLHGLDKTTTISSSTVTASDVGTTFGAQIVPSVPNELVIAIATADFPLLAGNGAINFSGGPAGVTGGLFVEEIPAPTATTTSPQFFISSPIPQPTGEYQELLLSVY